MLTELIARNRAGQGGGLPSWCTAHPQTLAAILHAYRNDTAPILIEATCNQVNQSGGYTGMTPADFVGFVHGIARSEGVDFARVILGGDHLGPNPWKAKPAARAMAIARDMVAAYVAAGFTKIHLDASMACRGEVLAEAEMAARAADLCAVAESVAPGRLVYVIGTEVPVPGARRNIRRSWRGPRRNPPARPLRYIVRPLRRAGWMRPLPEWLAWWCSPASISAMTRSWSMTVRVQQALPLSPRRWMARCMRHIRPITRPPPRWPHWCRTISQF